MTFKYAFKIWSTLQVYIKKMKCTTFSQRQLDQQTTLNWIKLLFMLLADWSWMFVYAHLTKHFSSKWQKSLTVLIMLFDFILDFIWFHSLLQPDIYSAKLQWHCSVDSVRSCYKVINEI